MIINLNDEKMVKRFWKYVDKKDNVDECWEWIGNRTVKKRGSYGVMWVKTGFKKRKSVKAHRISLELFLGRDLNPGMMVLHSCDNPPCVNPHHLREGNDKDN